ncbi:MAG TPA: RICIN domain-containing protein [Ideonella sp.]|uniref:GH12 family glycosyl hydrolase domain-containing protein n=1 Tax=Ideonella sp. TaxID=1929293 RepID=UPI002E2FE22D|nr:RICIN domain-containing protein [Ideonella sp.]HEX5682813.1 RICIN domain-containing protein [Ideonella sp.]
MTKQAGFKLAFLALLVGQGPAFAVQTCEKFGSVPAVNGTFIVQNNFYFPAPGGTQCIDVDVGTGAFTVTGNNSVPTNGPPGGYPSIYKGCHWGGCSKDSGMPQKLSDISSVPSKFSVTPAGPGQWNISYDVWFAQTPTVPDQPDGTEVMIWINRSGVVSPAGQRTGDVTINGMDFEVWTAPKGSAGFNDKWHIVSYVAKSPRNAVDFDLLPFFRDSHNRGLLEDHWYLIDVEAGTEPWQNGYPVTVNQFDVTVKTGSTPPDKIDPKKWYKVVNSNSGKCVDDADFGIKNGAKVQQWDCNDSTPQKNQLWKFKPTGGGYYKVLVQQLKTLAWSTTNQGTGNGTPVQLWTYGDANHQQWKAESLGNGAWRFVGRGSGKCLDVPAASKENGVQLQIYDCNGTAAQSFKLIEP